MSAFRPFTQAEQSSMVLMAGLPMARTMAAASLTVWMN